MTSNIAFDANWKTGHLKEFLTRDGQDMKYDFKKCFKVVDSNITPDMLAEEGSEVDVVWSDDYCSRKWCRGFCVEMAIEVYLKPVDSMTVAYCWIPS